MKFIKYSNSPWESSYLVFGLVVQSQRRPTVYTAEWKPDYSAW